MELLKVGGNIIAVEVGHSQVPARLFDLGVYKIK